MRSETAAQSYIEYQQTEAIIKLCYIFATSRIIVCKFDLAFVMSMTQHQSVSATVDSD